VSLSDELSCVVVYYFEGADDVAVVVEWFAHSHVNDVVNFSGVFCDGVELVGDLACGKVSDEIQSAGSAEITAHPAAYLAGNAESSSFVGSIVSQEHGFHSLAVVQFEEIFYSAIGVGEFFDGVQPGDIKARIDEFLAKGFRQGGDVVNGKSILCVNKRKDVFCQIFFSLKISDEFFEFGQCPVRKIVIHAGILAENRTGDKLSDPGET